MGGLSFAERVSSDFDSPLNISASFLENMLYSDSVSIVGNLRPPFGPGPGSPIGGLTSAPGHRTLIQTLALYVEQTLFVDMTSFSGLQCPPNILKITDNLISMTSLTGLERISPSDNLVSVRITGNPLLKTAGAFAPLNRLLGCVGIGFCATGAATITSVDVQVGECSVEITTIDQLCAFVTSPSSTACPS
jgi:hypothetical protein